MKILISFACFIAAAAVFPAKGVTLMQENFEDTAFSSRGWYDSPRAALSANEHIPGSGSCFECLFKQGAKGCFGGTPGRRQFAEAETLFLSFWIKYSANYVGSGKPYHPHLFHFVTNKDDRWVGPSYTHLTTYTEQVGGAVRIALQDGRNNDTNCLLLNNGSFSGCNGNFNTYRFTEDRSVCACNGVAGDSGGRDCFNQGDGTYYSARYWDSAEKMFLDQAGPRYKGDWHFIECCFKMNSIVNGAGITDGVIQYWYDGALTIDLHHVLFRTGKYPDMKFNQFLIAPYIGDGSPADQYLWVDDLTVSTTRMPAGAAHGRAPVHPANSIFTVRAPAGRGIEIVAPRDGWGDASIRIVDVGGRTVWKSCFEKEKRKPKIRILSVSAGRLYFIVVHRFSQQTVEKLILAR